MGKYRWVYVCCVGAALAGTIATDRKQVLVLLILLVVLFAISALFWLFSARGKLPQLLVEDVSRVDQPISVKIVLEDVGLLPTGPVVVDLEYENQLFSLVETQQILLQPGKKKRLEYVLPYETQNCGKMYIRIKKVRTYDLLGILCNSKKMNAEQEIIIYPDIRDLQIRRSTLSVGKIYGDHYDVNRKGQDVSEVFDIRDYRPGDNVKSIHWKLSGKLDKVVVREFGNPTNYHTAVFYDLQGKEGLEDEQLRKLQNAVLQMSASLSKSMIREGYMHHLLTMNGLKEQETLIEDNNGFLQMLAEMLCQKISQSTKEHQEKMEVLSQESRFTKVIFICGALKMHYVRQLAEQSEVTVICLNLDGEEAVERGNNYSIVTIPVEKVKEKLQLIEL